MDAQAPFDSDLGTLFALLFSIWLSGFLCTAQMLFETLYSLSLQSLTVSESSSHSLPGRWCSTDVDSLSCLQVAREFARPTFKLRCGRTCQNLAEELTSLEPELELDSESTAPSRGPCVGQPGPGGSDPGQQRQPIARCASTTYPEGVRCAASHRRPGDRLLGVLWSAISPSSTVTSAGTRNRGAMRRYGVALPVYCDTRVGIPTCTRGLGVGQSDRVTLVGLRMAPFHHCDS
eukprot:3472197-Rhodomonas_salina.2